MKNFFAAIFFWLLCQLLPNTLVGQQFYKFKADFSIKEKFFDGTSRLFMGKVYYNKEAKKIIYNITFPEAETWVIQDTVLYRLKAKKVVEKQKSFLVPNASIFYYALTGQLADYGFKKSPYKVEQVEKAGNMVISTWQPNDKLKKVMGKVVMSNVNKKLNGVVFYKTTGEILNKQFYKNYINVSGCEFPTEVTQITYLKSGQNYQVTTYKNVVINQNGEEGIYNFVVPK